MGEEHPIASKALGDERKLKIWKPQGYESTDQTYPVLYLLDGERWFNYAASLAQLFSEYGYTPDFIIVGIDTDDRARYPLFANGERLIQHIEQEVMPIIDAKYRTQGENLLFGWQFAGAFAIEWAAKAPERWKGIFAASPIPLSQSRLQAFEKNLQDSCFKNLNLLFTTSQNENAVEPGAIALEELLQKYPEAGVRWKYHKSANEEIVSFGHRTTPLSTLYQGLRFHFSDYPLLEFNDLASYEKAGGFDYVMEYYRQRAKKYGLPADVPQEGQFFLVRLGLDANHFPTFSTMMDAFFDKELMEETNLGWGSRYAEFYMTHDHPEGAIKVYQKLIERFPDQARPLNGLGKAFQAQGEIEKAREHLEKAVVLAEQQNDRRTEQYRQDLVLLLELKNK